MSEITLKLTIDGKEGLAVLKLTDAELLQIANDVKKVSGETKISGSKMVQTFADIKFTIEGIREAYGVLKQMFAEPMQKGAEIQVLRDNFKGTAEDIKLFSLAVAGTVEEGELIKLANQATGLGLDMQQTAILLSMAEDMTDKIGGTVTENFQKLLFASEGNIRGLKSLAIQTKLYDAEVDKMAKSHGDVIEKLDIETQKQIRLEALVKLSGLTIEDVRNKTADNADILDQSTVTYKELQEQIGITLNTALIPLLSHYTKIFKQLQETNPEVVGFAGSLGLVTAAGVGLNAVGILPLIFNFPRLAKEIRYASGIMKVAAAEGIAAEGAMMGASIAAKGFFASIGPIGWAIIGLTALAEVWHLIETNTKNAKATAENYFNESVKDLSNYSKAQLQEEKKNTEELIALNKKQIEEKQKLHNESLSKRKIHDKEGNEYEIKQETEKSKLYSVEANQLKKINEENEKKIKLIDEQIKAQAKLNKNNTVTAPDGLLGKIKTELDELEKKKPFAETIEALVAIEKKIVELTANKNEIELTVKDIVTPRKSNVVDTSSTAPKGLDPRGFVATKEILPEEEAEQKKIALIDNEYERQRALADFEYNLNVKKYGDLEILKQEHSAKIREIDNAETENLSAKYSQHFSALVGMAESATTSQQNFAKQLEQYILRSLSQILIDYISTSLAEQAVFEAKETAKTTMLATSTATQAAISTAATAASTATTVASMGTITTAAAPAAALTSIATAGGSAWIGYAAVAAVLGLIAVLVAKGKKEGGYTGSGDPNEIAGVHHKEEYVFEADLVRGNVGKFEKLRNMLRAGVPLEQIYNSPNNNSTVKTILAVDNNMMNMQMRNVSSGGGGNDFSKVEKVMSKFVSEVRTWQRELAFKQNGFDMVALMDQATHIIEMNKA